MSFAEVEEDLNETDSAEIKYFKALRNMVKDVSSYYKDIILYYLCSFTVKYIISKLKC